MQQVAVNGVVDEDAASHGCDKLQAICNERTPGSRNALKISESTPISAQRAAGAKQVMPTEPGPVTVVKQEKQVCGAQQRLLGCSPGRKAMS